MVDGDCVLAVLRDTRGQAECKYPNGELSVVSLAMAFMGTKLIREANLPPEVPNETLQEKLGQFGKVIDVQKEMWSKAYGYKVPNGIRQVMVMLTRHVPSHLTVAGYTVLLSYGGQPATC